MRKELQPALQQLSRLVLGKEEQLKLSVVCLLANGHLLLEDLPGMGKTTLSHAIAKVFGLGYKRVQFTNDMLPADLLGVNIFDQAAKGFRFHRGPVFTNLLLADEINRATPKTQSALLEAMEERQVSIDGKTRPLKPPFFVIATQNPQEQSGTYPLPESQLDRFHMRLSLGYPSAESEMKLLRGISPRAQLRTLDSVFDESQLIEFQRAAAKVKLTDNLISYLYRLVAATRRVEGVTQGLSPRASLVLLSTAKAHAWVEGRDYVVPEDIQAVFASVACHRLRGQRPPQEVVEQLLASVDVLES